MPFSVGTSARAVALDVADVDQALDDRRARGRRADPRFLHRLAQRLFVDELAGGLHRAEQRGVRVAPRRLGLLLLGVGLARVDRLALLELRQLRMSSPSAGVDRAPAGHDEHAAAVLKT